MNIYELESRYQQLMDKDELSAEDCIELDSLHDTIEDDCISLAKYIRNLEAQADAIERESTKMHLRAVDLYTKIDRNKSRLLKAMMNNNLTKITKSPLISIQLKQNPPKVIEYDLKQIPEAYWHVPIPPPRLATVDKNAIKKALNEGREVPGATLVSDYRIEFK